MMYASCDSQETSSQSPSSSRVGCPLLQAGVTFTNLVNFVAAKGAYPAAGLIQATDGNFYGTTYVGGLSGIPGYGTVFRISPDGTFSNLFSFNGTNGANPYSGLVQGTNGNFYGTTESGGTNGGYGTVFEITSAGALTPLVSFDGTNGANPEAGLVLGIDGNFYGTTSQGGTNGGLRHGHSRFHRPASSVICFHSTAPMAPVPTPH